MNSPSDTCNNCGSAHRQGASFCPICGEELDGQAAPAKKARAAGSQMKPAGKPPAASAFGAMVSATAKSAGMSALKAAASATPWQVVVGDKLPPNAIQGILKSAGRSAMRSAGQSLTSLAAQSGPSLLGPAFQSFAATALQTITPLLTGGDLNPDAAIPKLGLALVTLAAGAIAGKRRGVASFIMLATSVGLALLQGGTLLSTLQQVLDNPAMLGDLLPVGVTQGLSVFAAVRAGLKSIQK